MKAAQFVYVLADAGVLKCARESGLFVPEHYETDGFIHGSSREQLVKSATQFFNEVDNLVALEVEVSSVSSILKFEPGRSGTLYPHIYGPLPLTCVKRYIPIPRSPDGSYVLPDVLADDISPNALSKPR